MTINDPVSPNGAGDGRRSAQRLSFYNVVLSEQEAWFGVTIAALFNAVGMLLEIAITREIPGVSARSSVLSATVGVILLIVLFIRRKTPSVKWANWVYLINTAAIVTSLLSTNLAFALVEKNWVPFQAHKLGCLIAAMIAPGFWSGLLSILGFSLSPVLQFEFF